MAKGQYINDAHSTKIVLLNQDSQVAVHRIPSKDLLDLSYFQAVYARLVLPVCVSHNCRANPLCVNSLYATKNYILQQ